mmetsp:Transcript_3620/g.3420  ORF Transcript_3620/g.3420 Transcript_3620/m.3420 type:complete len:95 (+) Transcript_3620:161-445(+)
MSEYNLPLVKHISSPPIVPHNRSDEATKTNTACKPFPIPALVAPPGKNLRVLKYANACIRFDKAREQKIVHAIKQLVFEALIGSSTKSLKCFRV